MVENRASVCVRGWREENVVSVSVSRMRNCIHNSAGANCGWPNTDGAWCTTEALSAVSQLVRVVHVLGLICCSHETMA